MGGDIQESKELRRQWEASAFSLPMIDRTKPCKCPELSEDEPCVRGTLYILIFPMQNLLDCEKVPRDLFPWRNSPCLCVHIEQNPCLHIYVKILHSRTDLPQPGNSTEKNLMIRNSTYTFSPDSHSPWVNDQASESIFLCFRDAMCALRVVLGHGSLFTRVKTQTRCCVPKIFESI